MTWEKTTFAFDYQIHIEEKVFKKTNRYDIKSKYTEKLFIQIYIKPKTS